MCIAISLFLFLKTTPIQLCHMLQNDIGNENDNGRFIVPGIPDSSKSKTSSRGGRHKGFSTYARETDDSGHDGGRFISYEKFRSRYWNRFDQSITQDLGMCVIPSSCGVCNFWGRSRAGFQRNFRGDQRFRASHWHATTVFRSGYLLVSRSPGNVRSREGRHIRAF